MFTDEELNFIKTMLEDELFAIEVKRCKFENYDDSKLYYDIVKQRVDYMQMLLLKIIKNIHKQEV